MRGCASRAAMCGRLAMPIGPRASSMVIATPNCAERLDEHAHRRQRAMVDHGPGPVEDHGLEVARLAHDARPCPYSSPITSSAMAKEVLAPVPLVMTTIRTESDGRSTSISRSLAEA